MLPPPQIPNRYDSEDAQLRRLEAQESAERRKWLIVFVGGIVLLLAAMPLALVGWLGVMALLAPIGLGMIIGAGIQLFVERIGS